MLTRLCRRALQRIAPLEYRSTERDRRGEEAARNARRHLVWGLKLGAFGRIAVKSPGTVEDMSYSFNEMFCGGNVP